MIGLLVGLLGVAVIVAIHSHVERREAQEDLLRSRDRADALTDMSMGVLSIMAETSRDLANEKAHSAALGDTLQRVNQRAVAHERTIEFLLRKMIEIQRKDPATTMLQVGLPTSHPGTHEIRRLRAGSSH